MLKQNEVGSPQGSILSPLLANIYLIDVAHRPLDFRYRLIGTGITQRSEYDYTGMRLMDLRGQRRPSLIWSMFEASVLRRAPVCRLIPHLRIEGKFVEKLALPLSSDGGEIDMLIGAITFDPTRFPQHEPSAL